MNLSEVYKMLAGAEEGDEAKNFLKSFVADKDKNYSTIESQLNTAETTLKNLADSLGVKPEETLVALKGLKGKENELKTLTDVIGLKDTEINTLKSEVNNLQRREKLADFAAIVGADKEVLIDLLPPNIDFEIKETTEDGKLKRQGVILQGKDSTPFADYVASDSKLSRFSASIFTQANNPPVAPKLPTGKSPDSPKTSGLAEAISANQKQKAAAIRSRFS